MLAGFFYEVFVSDDVSVVFEPRVFFLEVRCGFYHGEDVFVFFVAHSFHVDDEFGEFDLVVAEAGHGDCARVSGDEYSAFLVEQ